MDEAEQRELIAYLTGESGFKNTRMYSLFSDMNVPDQIVENYSNSLHNLKLQAGDREFRKRLLDFFRTNPIVAVEIMRRCTTDNDILELVISVLFYESAGFSYGYEEINWRENQDGSFRKPEVILNPHKIPYMTLLIEAVHQDEVCDDSNLRERVLSYALNMDWELHKKGVRSKYYNGYNLRHILSHIPEYRQMEFINWFWDRHCTTVLERRRPEKYSGQRVAIMMKELPKGAIWRHLENGNKLKLSERESRRLEKEKAEIRRFIKNVFQEKEHMDFISVILGDTDISSKLDRLMEDTVYSKKYPELYGEWELRE